MKIALILNGGAGTLRGGDSAALAKRIAAIFAARSHQVATTLARTGREAVDAVHSIVAQKSTDAIVVGGGDGTVSAAAAACAASGAVLGILPLGTMNLFARSLHMPLTAEAAAEALADGEVAAVDIGRVNGRYFVHVLSLGLHPALVEERERSAAYRSRIEKMMGSVRSWFRVVRRPHRLFLSIATAETTLERETIGLVVSNNVLGSGHLPYADRLDTGLLGIYLTRARSTLEIARLTAEVAVGLTSASPLVEHLTSHAASIRLHRSSIKATIDGELLRLAAPIRVESLGGGLKVLRPRAPQS